MAKEQPKAPEKKRNPEELEMSAIRRCMTAAKSIRAALEHLPDDASRLRVLAYVKDRHGVTVPDVEALGGPVA